MKMAASVLPCCKLSGNCWYKTAFKVKNYFCQQKLQAKLLAHQFQLSKHSAIHSLLFLTRHVVYKRNKMPIFERMHREHLWKMLFDKLSKVPSMHTMEVTQSCHRLRSAVNTMKWLLVAECKRNRCPANVTCSSCEMLISCLF